MERRKTIAITAAIVAVMIGAGMTCPDKQQHKDAIVNAIRCDVEEEKYETEAMKLVSAVRGKILGGIMKNAMFVDDYVLYSVGSVVFDDESRVVSIGVFGHVFVLKSRIDKI